MFGTQHFALFVISGLLLNLTPGQDTIYIIGRSVSQGRRGGLLSALGIVSGTVVHTVAAAFGLSAILATSTQAFVGAFLFLGGVCVFNGALWCLALVWAASAMSRRLQTRPTSGQWLKRATGTVFVGLGVRLSVSR